MLQRPNLPVHSDMPSATTLQGVGTELQLQSQPSFAEDAKDIDFEQIDIEAIPADGSDEPAAPARYQTRWPVNWAVGSWPIKRLPVFMLAAPSFAQEATSQTL
jgi:hypothetical protein